MDMPVFVTKFFDNIENSKLAKQNVILTRQVKNLITQIQGSHDITVNPVSADGVTYIGTPTRYNSYSKQVAQLAKMYDNVANWGCMIAKNVIDVRTAFSVGEGLDVKKRVGFEGDATKELEWVVDFMHFNNLDNEMPQEYAKEAEIEGKVLFRFLIDLDAKNVRLVHVPWRQYQYEILTPDWDFYNFVRARYIGSGDPKISFDLLRPFFVYGRFGGNSYKVNITPPKTAFVIREMEDLDRAVVDWRIINRLFSAPTPVISAPDKQTAKEINEWIDKKNWKIGMMLILGGIDVKFELVGWKGDGYTTLKEETQSLVKTVSGTTGIPVHFLGYPELLSNRETAEHLIELIVLSTSKERETWVKVYEKVFQKAMVFYNTEFGTNLNPGAVEAVIEETKLVSQAQGAVKNAPVSNSNNPGGNTG